MSMDRRSFFRALPMPLAAGALLATGNSVAIESGFVEQQIVKRIRPCTDCDLTYTAVEYGISEIIAASGSVPRSYRVTCGAWLYPTAKIVSKMFKSEADLIIYFRENSFPHNERAWSVEGNGILFWSPGT